MFLQVRSVELQLIQIVEGVDTIQFAGINQADVDVTDARPLRVL